MRYYNSYIFLRRDANEKKSTDMNNVIRINETPSFEKLLKKTFKQIKFDYKNHDFNNSGSFEVKINDKIVYVLFKYHNVGKNYYLDILVEKTNKLLTINALSVINDLMLGKKNRFDEYYISIVSYDYVSEYYCNKLFPLLNEFERKLRKVLFIIYTLKFDLEYYKLTTDSELQDTIKKKSKQLNTELNKINNDNVSNKDCFIKYAFYSLDYSEIEQLLFSESVIESDCKRLQDFLNSNHDLSKLEDDELRKAFQLLIPRTDWDRFFGDKKIDNDFKSTLNDIRVYRNNTVHCKFINKKQYDRCKSLLKETIKSLDKAILMVERKDFINKNLGDLGKSLERFSKIVSEISNNILNPIKEYMKTFVQPSKELTKAVRSLVSPLSEMNLKRTIMVLPEIEAIKYNIPNDFCIKETENDDQEED